MPSVNEDLIESAFIAELRRRGATDAMVLEVQRVIRDEVLPDIAEALNRLPFDTLTSTDERLIAMRNAITDAMGWDRVNAPLKSGVLDVAGDEALQSAKELSNAMPFPWEFLVPSPDLLMNTVFNTPFNGKLMGEWFGQLEQTAQDGIYEAFRIGMIEGKSIPQMAKDLLLRSYDSFTTTGIKRVFDNAEAVARTAANYASTQTRLVFAEANSDVIKGVQYIATLDDRTSMICMSLNGTVYPIDDIGAVPPQHYNCRSTLGYVTRSWEEMGLDGREPEFVQRYREEGASRMDGKISAPPDFDTWLKTQPQSVQDKLLGPVRAGMWRDGKVKNISDFVGKDGQTILLKDFGLNRAGNPLKPGDAVLEWKPMMTAKEAEAWAAKSAFKDSLYHGTGITERGVVTDPKALAVRIDSITTNGFNISTENNGRMLGDGVYFTPSRGTASRYGTVLEARVNVKNVASYTYDEWSRQYRRINREMKAAGLKLSTTERINWWASNNGIDAINITTGLPQMVVFDPKNIVVIQ